MTGFLHNKKFLRFLSIACILCTAFSMSNIASSMTLRDRVEEGRIEYKNEEYDKKYAASSYFDTRKEYQDKKYDPAPSGSEVLLNHENLTDTFDHVTVETVEGRPFVMVQGEENQYAEWRFSVPQSGLYRLQAVYRPMSDTMSDISRALLIDGKLPFDECGNIVFLRQWKDAGEPWVNSIGNEVKPGVEQIREWQTVDIYDSEGYYAQPLLFYLEAGTHTLRLEVLDEPLAIESLSFLPPEKLPSYKEYAETHTDKAQGAADIRFEAEKNMVTRSHSTLRMLSSSDPAAYPQKLGNTVMNVMGGAGWGGRNGSITWTFHVPEGQAGRYKLMFRLQQSFREGLPSYRTVAIDGAVPFEEFSNLRFAYNKKWRSQVLVDDNDTPYEIYLDEGDHTLTMTARQGPLTEVTDIITKDSALLSDLILKIVMVTGQVPDPNYDYRITERIPELMEQLNGVLSNMDRCMEVVKGISGGKMPNLYNQLKVLKEQLASLMKEPYYIPMKTDDITSILNTYSGWIDWLNTGPLTLDYISFLPVEQETPNYNSTLWQNLQAAVVNFFKTFYTDYGSVSTTDMGDVETKTSLDVWVARGKDWGTLIKRMADEEFTAKTGIEVKMHIVPAGQLNSGSANALLLAISSGNAPDVGMATPMDSVGEFAIRNAVYDVSQFPDYKEVESRFYSELFRPVSYNGGIFALPETMSFKSLFYRKDIVETLGIRIPSTWEELYNYVIPVLYQNNMQLFVPRDFDIMVYQYGAEYYNENRTQSALNSPQAYQAFKEMCELYTVYGVPVEANFYNRFRTGEVPMGVGGFDMYMQLLAAAPEIKGRWGIAQLPGHEIDGKLNRSQGGAAGEAVMILSQTQKADEAWEFLKWWTDTETQTVFGTEIEALMGKTARWNTANIEAFDRMAWPKSDLTVIKKALSEINQSPVVLGGYFTSRHMNNAFNRVVVSGMNPRDSLEQGIKDINRELVRRQESVKK